jgi:small subunit ribosomal protein S2
MSDETNVETPVAMEPETPSEAASDSHALRASLGTDSPYDPVLLEQLVKIGVLYGKRKSKTDPRMKQFIYSTRNGVEFFDAGKTLPMLERAMEFLTELAKERKLIMVVGTVPAAKGLAQQFSAEFNYPCVTERWLGGTLTNFKTISERIQYYIQLKEDSASGQLEKYTKKEQGRFTKKIEKLRMLFEGLTPLNRVPDALLVINPMQHNAAVREARKMNIPIVALMSSDANPEAITYPIPGNDNAKGSIEWFFGHATDAVKKGIAYQAPEPTPEAEATEIKKEDA